MRAVSAAAVVALAVIVLLPSCTSPAVSRTTTSAPLSTTSSSPSISVTTSSTTTAPPPIGAEIIVPERPPGTSGLGLTAAELASIPTVVPRVVELLPHDQSVATEGLTVIDDFLLESTGLHGRSSRRVLDPETGDLLRQLSVRPEIYATGIAALDGEAVQFSRLEEVVMVFSPFDLELTREVPFPFEVNGACLVSGQEDFIAFSSPDGTINFLDPSTFTSVRSIQPAVGETKVGPLGDLSCGDGSVWGVVVGTGVVVQINADDGSVEMLADLSALTPAGVTAGDELSGIAHRPETETWFVTGRRWDVLYEIDLQ